MDLLNRIKTLCRVARTSAARSDSGSIPVQQHKHMGKTSRAVPWFPFGYDANVPVDELAVLLAMMGDPGGPVALQGSPGQGPSLASSEVAVYHPATGSTVHFKASGDIEIEAGLASITLTRDQNITATTGLATFDISPLGLVTLTGNLVVTGFIQAGLTITGLAGMYVTQGLQVIGQTTLAGVTSNGTDVGSTHVHTGSPSAPSGPVSNTGTPV